MNFVGFFHAFLKLSIAFFDLVFP